MINNKSVIKIIGGTVVMTGLTGTFIEVQPNFYKEYCPSGFLTSCKIELSGTGGGHPAPINQQNTIKVLTHVVSSSVSSGFESLKST